MRHQRTGKRLGRDSAHRKALYANLAGALIEHGRIRTTIAKAKAVKPLAEQMITLGRRGDLHARRQAVAVLGSKDIVHKLFDEVGPRFADRPGGYSRIVKIGPRPGDAAEMVYLELIDEAHAPRERPVASVEAPVSEDLVVDEAELETDGESLADAEDEGGVEAEVAAAAATDASDEAGPSAEADPEAGASAAEGDASLGDGEEPEPPDR
jgi:large subunit ribosomal protein L17